MKLTVQFLLAVILLAAWAPQLGLAQTWAQGGSHDISSETELAQLAQDVINGQNYAGTTFTLTADLNLSSHSPWTPIGTLNNTFNGTFNGNGKTIENLTISASGNYAGLFANVGGGTVMNLTLTNVDITGQDCVGGVAGTVEGGAIIDNCTVSGKIAGRDFVGGVTGDLYNGKIKNSSSSCEINATREIVGGVTGMLWISSCSVTDSYSTGDVTGLRVVGGVVGNAYDGTVENCYATGDVTATGTYGNGLNPGDDTHAGGVVGSLNSGSISHCYATGDVHGHYFVGGVVGAIPAGASMTSCYATGAVSGNEHVGGLVGTLHTGGSMTDCAALNPSVTAITGEIHRLAGSDLGTINNCIAWDGMTIDGSTVSGGTLTNSTGDDFTAAQIHADNTLGNRFPSTPWTLGSLQLPGFGVAAAMPSHLALASAPTLTATAGVMEVELSWQAPGSNGGTILGYKYYISTSASPASPSWTTIPSSAALTSYTVTTGLTAGTKYFFGLLAETSAGDGPASNEEEATPYDFSDAPTGVSATAGDGEATITFTEPAAPPASPSDGGSSISGYTVNVIPDNGPQTTFTVTGTGSTITVTGLTNGTVYTFTVVATNAAGDGPASVATAAVTPFATIAAAAITITAPVTGNAPVTTATGGTEVSCSTVTWAPADATFAIGTTYTATVTISPASAAYVFAALTTSEVTVNGADATVVTDNNDGTFTVEYEFTATTTSYALTVAAGTGGTVAGSASSNYTEGTAISLTATPASSYRFVNWTVSGATVSNAAANPLSFNMPAANVTATANFEFVPPAPDPDLTDIYAAIDLVQFTTLQIPQEAANSEADARKWLAEYLRQQFNALNLYVSVNNISFSLFETAVAGTATNASGKHGAVTFSAIFSKGNQSVQVSFLHGRIVATKYVGTSNEVAASAALKAISEGGTLVISGLSAGDDLMIHNAFGSLIYKAKAHASEVRIDLDRGIYIIVSDQKTLKVVVR